MQMKVQETPGLLVSSFGIGEQEDDVDAAVPVVGMGGSIGRRFHLVASIVVVASEAAYIA